MFNSIKSLIRFAISGLIIIFIIISVLFLLSVKKLNNFRQLNDSFLNVSVYLNDLSNNQNAFLIHDAENKYFHQTQKSEYIKNYNKNYRKIIEELYSIRNADEFITDIARDTINKLISNIHYQKQNFDTLVQLILEKGWDKYGRVGRLNYYLRLIKTRQVEELTPIISQIEHEQQNYLLIGQKISAKRIKKLIDTARIIMLKYDPNLDPTKEAINFCNEYKSNLNRIIQIDDKLGFYQKDGIITGLEKINIITAEQNKFLINYIKNRLKKEFKFKMRLLALLIFVAFLGSILILAYLSKKLGEPLQKIIKSVKNMAQQGFSGKNLIPIYNKKDEISDLSMSLHYLVNKFTEKTIQADARRKELYRSYENVKMLNKIGRNIIAQISTDKIIRATYSQINLLLSVDLFVVGLTNKRLKTVDLWGIDTNKTIKPTFIKNSQKTNMITYCIDTQDDILITDKNNQFKNFDYPYSGTEQYLSQLYIPLTFGDNQIGVLAAFAKNKNEYSEYHLNIYRNLAMYLAIALHNAAFIEQLEHQQMQIMERNEELNQQKEEILSINESLQKQKKELETTLENIKFLRKIGQEITITLNVEGIIDTVLKYIHKLFDSTIFGIGVYNEKLKRLEFEKVVEKGRFLPFHYEELSNTERLAVRCFVNETEILINSLSAEFSKYFPQMPEPMIGELPESVIYLPLKAKDIKVGVITLQSFNPNAYSEKDLNLLRTLASYVAIALLNSKTFKELEEKQQEIEKINSQIKEKVKELEQSKHESEELAKELQKHIKKVKESEEKFANIINFLPDPFMVIDKEGKIIVWNKSMEKLTGVKAEKIIGKGNYEHALPFYGERRPMLIDLVLNPTDNLIDKYQEVKQVENVLIGQAYVPYLGVHLWGTAGLLYDSEGNITGAIQVSRDVSEKVKTQEELKKKNEEILKKTEELHELIEELKTTQLIIEEYNKELKKLSLVASNTDNGVIIANSDFEIEWVNEGFTRMTGYTLEEFKREKGDNLLQIASVPDINEILTDIVKNKSHRSYTSLNTTKNGQEIWVQTTLSPIFDEQNNLLYLIAIDTDITKIKEAEKQIEQKNKKITYSLQYARRIQSAILPPKRILDRLLADYFMLFKPRDIVSGDFYWVTRKRTKIIITVADCTGHGVPGAFMSILGFSYLNEIVNKIVEKPGYNYLHADEILNQLKDQIIKSLHQKNSRSHSKDGIDMALCIFDIDDMTLEYAGANNPVYVVRDKKEKCTIDLLPEQYRIDENDKAVLIELKPDKMPIGISARKDDHFTRKKIKIRKHDILYMFSDGYIDQFGGPYGRKFLAKNFRNLILSIHDKPIDKQKHILENMFENWRNYPRKDGKTFAQIDDIIVFGIQFS